MSLVWELTLPDSDKLVLLALADSANDDGQCWPSIATLARKCSKDARTVERVLKRLRDAGHVERVERPGLSNIWRVTPRHDAAPGTMPPRHDAVPTPRHDDGGTPRHDAAQTIREPSNNHQSDVGAADATPIEIDDERSGEPPLTAEEVLEAWNHTAGEIGLPKARLTPQRRRKLVPLIRSHTLEDFTEAIQAIKRSPFLRGENNRAWRADFDFFVQPSSFTKLIEGSYDRAH